MGGGDDVKYLEEVEDLSIKEERIMGIRRISILEA